jgi:hypothetical protein
VSLMWNRVQHAVGHFFRLVLATLREIGDENAYQRHLVIHGVPHSAKEWRKFCDERWLASSKRARCC